MNYEKLRTFITVADKKAFQKQRGYYTFLSYHYFSYKVIRRHYVETGGGNNAIS